MDAATPSPGRRGQPEAAPSRHARGRGDRRAQTGKSTLALNLAPGGRRYLSLDDLDVVDAARRDPDALVGGTQPVTLDEVQREPDLLHTVKRAIDRKRTPGRFLLTGSPTCC